MQSYSFASRVSGMQSSVIREILKVTEQPEVISFAGGLPAPELFPLPAMRLAAKAALGGEDGSILQYSTTEGYPPLREWIAGYLNRMDIPAAPDQILVTSGSQQGLDLLAKLFIDPGDAVLVGNPTYLGALQVFNSYQARAVPVPSDAYGMDPAALAQALRRYRPKLAYLMPTFQNPTGTTLGLERRIELVKVLAEADVPFLEDSPYRELRYSGTAMPPLSSLAGDAPHAFLGTFSKTVAPGLRLGWIATEPSLLAKLVLAKQGADLHTGTLVQRALYRYLADSDVSSHLGRLRREYGRRRDAMVGALRRHFPAGVEWTEPEGGMFLWVTLPEGANSTELLPRAIEQRVAYVPGSPFFALPGGENCMRLNFSNTSPERIEEGIERLAQVLRG
ncbi:MAG TPA: PLP-dependent aminotransferase family protein [Armatimonadota bacterium]|jgi:2-aminoadipate transaminase